MLAAALRTSEVRGDVGNNQRPAAFGGRSLSAAKYSSKRNKNVDHSHTPRPTTQARRHALDEASVLNLVPPAANNTTQSLADPFFDMDPIDSSFPAAAPDLSPTASSGQDSTRSAVSATIPVGISDLFRRRGSTGNRCLQTQTPFSVPEFPLNSVTHHFCLTAFASMGDSTRQHAHRIRVTHPVANSARSVMPFASVSISLLSSLSFFFSLPFFRSFLFLSGFFFGCAFFLNPFFPLLGGIVVVIVQSQKPKSTPPGPRWWRNCVGLDRSDYASLLLAMQVPFREDRHRHAHHRSPAGPLVFRRVTLTTLQLDRGHARRAR